MKENLNKLIADAEVRKLIEHSIETRALFISYPKEINISNFLAWLFNPREGHGLGDKAIKELLLQIYDGANQPIQLLDSTELNPFNIFNGKLNNFNNVIIQRELKVNKENKNAIDLAIFDTSNKIAIFIEVKFGAPEGKGQTNGYYKGIHTNVLKAFSGYTPIFVFLDSQEKSCENTAWISLNMEWLVDFLKRQKDSPLIHQSNQNILSEYAEFFGEETRMAKLLNSYNDSIFQIVSEHKDILKHFNNTFRGENYIYIVNQKKHDIDLINTYYQSKEFWDFLADQVNFLPLIAPIRKIFPEVEIETRRINISYHFPQWASFYVEDFKYWGVQIWLKRQDSSILNYELHTEIWLNYIQLEYQEKIKEKIKEKMDVRNGRKIKLLVTNCNSDADAVQKAIERLKFMNSIFKSI